MKKFILTLFLLVLPMLSALDKAYAEIPAQMAIKAIMGEARGEFGYKKDKKLMAMVLIGEAIRNRSQIPIYKKDPMGGIYGFNAKNIKEPSWVWSTAKEAWNQSASTNYLKGGYIWGTKADIKKFSKQEWFKNMEPVLTYGNHTFFREKSRHKKGVKSMRR